MSSLLSINPKQEKEKIVIFLKKTFKEQKINKAILGLSGGLDSTTGLYLLKEVLPAKNIFAVQMDYYPKKKLNIDLKGINIINVSIKSIVDMFNVEGSTPNFFSSVGTLPTPSAGVSQVAKKLVSPPSINKVRVGNIMTRVRMIILFDLAKKYSALVCGTENKSEKLLGYFTRFGDSASDIEPLSHLYKTQVYQLAKYLKVPEKIINQSPTAGLWTGQTDEGEFGFTYLEADQVLHQYYDKKKSIKQIKQLGFKNIQKIIKRSLNNKFKLKVPYSL
jgi:NAD+ synthase